MERAERELEKLNRELDEKTSLNWVEKQAVKSLMRKLKRAIKKYKKKTEREEGEERELRTRVIKAILEMSDMFNIQIEKYNEKGVMETDKEGKPVIIDATKIDLELTPTDKLIEILEDVVKASEEIVR